jgi:hypothetical protein
MEDSSKQWNNVRGFVREMRLLRAEQVEKIKNILASAQQENAARVRQLVNKIRADEAEERKRMLTRVCEINTSCSKQSYMSDVAYVAPEIQAFLQRAGDIINLRAGRALF